jgi:hypothetical protein
MKRILKRNFLRIAVLMLFFSIASHAGTAGEEFPLLPMTVEGVALIDGTPAPNGTFIEAYLNGEQVGKLLVNTSSGNYCFWISGTAEDEGKPITFTVGGKNTKKILTWEPGQQVLSFQLSVGEGADLESYTKSGISGINSESRQKIGNLDAIGENSKSRIIESSVPAPDSNMLKNMSGSFWDKKAANSADDSSKLKSIPGFSFCYSIADIIVLFFGLKIMKERD